MDTVIDNAVADEVTNTEDNQNHEQVKSVIENKSTETDFTKLINPDGSFKDEFYSSLPDDLGSHSSIKQIKNIVDLNKSYVNTKGLVGKKLEEFWTSKDESIAAKRREIMGIPGNAEGYEIDVPELPENVPYSKEALNEFKELASKISLSKEQAKALAEWDTQRAISATEGISKQIESQMQEAESSLRKDWGNKYEYNISKVKQTTDYLGITDKINDLGLGREPEFLKMVIEKLVPAVSNDKLVENSQKETLATVSDSLDDIETKMIKWDGSTRDPEYQSLVKQRTELLKKLS
jgi:hypothetical protein